MKIVDILKEKLPQEAIDLIEKHPTVNSPDKFLANAMKSIADLMKADLEGKEVLIGKDGKYDRYQWK